VPPFAIGLATPACVRRLTARRKSAAIGAGDRASCWPLAPPPWSSNRSMPSRRTCSPPEVLPETRSQSPALRGRCHKLQMERSSAASAAWAAGSTPLTSEHKTLPHSPSSPANSLVVTSWNPARHAWHIDHALVLRGDPLQKSFVARAGLSREAIAIHIV